MRGKLISESYKIQNTRLHQERDSYGAGGAENADRVREIVKKYNIKNILDYGCGKADLSQVIPNVTNYDPAIKEYGNEPGPADLVICTDVLEHIEPEYLDNVLDHLCTLTKKMIFISVATRPAKKILTDGRNAHLIQEQIEWWMPKLRKRFKIVSFWGDEGEFYAIGESDLGR